MWMTNYLAWLATHPEAELSKPSKGGYFRPIPTTAQRIAKASFLANRRISPALIKELERRPDSIDYFTKIQQDVAFRARELAQQTLAYEIEARAEGLRQAMGNAPGEGFKSVIDHRAVQGYTSHIPDLAYPKKVMGQESAPRITINIVGADAQRQIAKVFERGNEEILDVEVEEVEMKRLTDGEDDA